MRRLIVSIASKRWFGPLMLAINLAVPVLLVLYFTFVGPWPTGKGGGSECGMGQYKYDC
jgi:hypothetical protein